MKTERAKLIRNAKRCLADLCGGHVWQWTVSRTQEESRYVLRVRRNELARDEINTLSALAGEDEASSFRG